MDPTLIVLVSFVIFIGIAYRLGYQQSLGILDQKIASIRQALNEAAQAKEAAIQALHEERSYHEEILKEVELITKRTEEQALTLRQQALHDINKMISVRQQAAENMINHMHNAALQKIQDEATAKTIATFEALAKEFSSAEHTTLNDTAIAQIASQLTKRRATIAPKQRRVKAKPSVSRSKL